MKKIYKYSIPVTQQPMVEIPVGAKILAVGVQDNAPVVWAEVDEKAGIDMHVFYLFATGREIPDFLAEQIRYIGTFQVNEGAAGSKVFVGHLYEQKNQ